MAKVYDLNRMKKTYPLIRKIPRLAKIDDSQIESVLIDMSDGLPKTYTFSNTYYTVPVCIATSEQENVNVFITNVTLTTVTLEISAEPESTCKIHLQIFRNTSD